MSHYIGSGDLGWRSLSDLPTIFSDRVKNMKPGQISNPIKAPNGYHILKLLSTRTGGSTLTDQQIQNIIMQQKFGKALKKWFAAVAPFCLCSY